MWFNKSTILCEIQRGNISQRCIVFVRCPTGIESKIHSGEADCEPVIIHDCRHCRTHEFL